MKNLRLAVTACAMMLTGLASGSPDEGSPDSGGALINSLIWPGFAGGPDLVSVAHPNAQGPETISVPRWVRSAGGAFLLQGQTGVVVTPTLVIAAASTGPTAPGPNILVAFSRLSGDVVWMTGVPAGTPDSRSVPSVDVQHDALIVACGQTLCAVSLEDGSRLWTTSLGSMVLNASPAVTADLGSSDRVFISDYSYAGDAQGRLFCVNTDARHPTENPYDPGEIVWTVDLRGETSGNTPAYKDGVVYVTTASGGADDDQGMIRAYDAHRRSEPSPIWVYQHTDATGFFSGPAVKGGAVYASSYSFHGGQFSASTVKLDRATGQQLWSVPTNRTDTTPVPLDDGRVLVSGGVPFTGTEFPDYGSLPSLQMIYETGWGAAVRLWDSAIDTLDDTDADASWDSGESFLSIGGWTIQPVVFERNGRMMAFVGSSPDPAGAGYFGHSNQLSLVDLDKQPGDAGFVVQTDAGCGASPAMVGSELYTIGAAGLHAYGMPDMTTQQVMAMWASGTLPDMNHDGIVDLRDLYIALQLADD